MIFHIAANAENRQQHRFSL